MADWWNYDELEALHYPEIIYLARRLTGCQCVVIIPALHRSREQADTHPDYGPIEFAHSDYTEAYGGMIADPDHPYCTVFEPNLALTGVSHDDIRRARRVVVLQFWRNIGPIAPDRPIAFCDCQTVSRTSLMPMLLTEYGGLRMEFEVFIATPPAASTEHHWYTFPEMGIDEVVVFRTYDSERAERGEPFWTLHPAFPDPNTGPDAPGRESVEVRAICLFD